MPKFLLLSVGLEPATICLQSRHIIHSATEGSPVLAPLKGAEIWAFFVVSVYSDFK